MATAERERRRIERDLHDGAQQALVTAKVQLAALRQEATRLDPALSSGFDEVPRSASPRQRRARDLARGVHPMALTEGGLASALRHAVASFPGDATVDIRTARRFDPEVERAVYFCLTEALQNAFKHGGDGIRVRLVLDGDESELRFAVCDDGPGFDPAGALAPAPGSTTWSSGSALSVGNSPSAPRSGAAPASPERYRPARFPRLPHPELRPALPRDTRWPSGTSAPAHAEWTSAPM